ncbi:MAG TPA: hypothetical protein VGG03_01820 [Thermoanaerobaculia bacterium]|jgi:hypothetical protein
MTLDELQRSLAASLAGRQAAPEGCDLRALERARAALEAKRRRAAQHLLPRLRAALGAGWDRRFHEHARAYGPAGRLHHVDDAWELAEAILRERDPQLFPAAHDDLLALRLRWVRDRRADADRIRERRGPLVAITRTVPRRLIVRLAGGQGKVFRIP